MTPLLTPAEALDRLAGGLDDDAFGATGTAEPPIVAVLLDDDPTTAVALDRVTTILRAAPVVLVGVVLGGGPLPGVGLGLDVLVCEHPDPPRPWVGRPDGAMDELDRLGTAVASSTTASTVLVQLLRVTEALSAADAVVAESLVYSLLQTGATHGEWLAARADRPRRPRPENPVVQIKRDDARLLLTLDRPEVRNAFGAEMRDQLIVGLQLAGADPSITEIELRGSGPAFCSGGDLDEFGTATDALAAHGVRTTRSTGVHLARLADRVTTFVHGPCIGAGVELAAFAHRVIARSDATFSLPEVAMGLVPGAGGTASVPRRIGRHRAAHLALGGRPIDAVTALSWGLVDAVDDAAFGEPSTPGGAHEL